MATPLPDLSDYNLSVSPYQSLSDISRVFGAGAGFGAADYVAALQAGYTDPQIVAFLKANPYLDASNISGKIASGLQNQLINTGIANLSTSDPNRAALVNPNPTSFTDPYIQKGIPGRGNDPSVQMANANVNVAGNDTYNQLMQASQAGTLVMAKSPDKRNFMGQLEPSSTYQLIDSATGKVVSDNVSPSQTNGVYQFRFGNPQSEGSVNAYIRADPTTGAVGAIDPSKNLSYQSGMGGGMLSGIAGMALPLLTMALAPELAPALSALAPETMAAADAALSGLGLGSGTAANLAANALTTAGKDLITGQSLSNIPTNLISQAVGADVAQNVGLDPSLNKSLGNAAGALTNAALTGTPINPQALGTSLALTAAKGALPNLTGPTGQTPGIIADSGTTPSATAALPADQVGALSNLQDNSGDIGTSYDLTPPAPPVHEDSPMGSMANIGIPYQGQGAISGADALDPTTAYYNSFDLTNPSAEASAGTTTSYGDGTGQSFYNVPTIPVSQQEQGVPTDYTSVPISSGYALTPDLTGPNIAPSNATLNGQPVQSAAPVGTGISSQNYFNSVTNQAAQNTPTDKTGRTLLTPTMFTGQAPTQQQNILSPLAQLQLALSGYQPALTKAVRQRMASGGQPHQTTYHPEAKLGDHIFRTGGPSHYVDGKGDGQSDDIPAMLAKNEYVFDADTVAQLGNGSSEAGAKLLDKFREAVRRHKRSAPDDKIPPKAKKLTSYLKEAERG